ncbi:MAG: O-antigen ligase family protein [Heteroscytonema crispum UTEX LB 1556]
MRNLPDLAEKAFIVISLFLSAPALVPVLLNTEDVSGIAADPYTPIIFLGIYLVTLVLIAKRWKSFVFVASKDIWIWLLVGIAIASISWTISPDITLRRSILLLGTTLFGVYFAMRYTLREQLQLLAWALGLIVVLSFVFAIALPSYGLMTTQEGGIHAGSWKGVMTHKNILGRVMVFSTMVFLFVALANPFHKKYRWIPWAGYILSVALILLSTSKTSLITWLTLMAIMPLYRAWRRNYTQLVPLTITLILVIGGAAILISDNLEVIAGALGRDLTLTGRSDIWAVMFEVIWERPLFGYGFNAFWRGWETEVSSYVWRTLGWECPYGHNGFMDLFAELGISGLVVFLFSFVTAYVRGVSWLRITRTVEGLWALMYLTFLIVYNISESTLVATNSIYWIVYVSMIFSMAVEHEQAQKMNYSRAIIAQEEWIEMEASNQQNL